MKVYLAPMEGVVDFVIRDLFSRIGGYDQMVTEFIRVTDKLNPPKVFHRYCPELKTGGKTRSGTPVFVQLLGGDPVALAENAHLARQLGAPGIDLNFGCPAKTVNRHDGGAKLLTHPHRLFDIISSIKKVVTDVPVTAKVRLGYEDKSLCREIARAVDEAGAHHLIVHARTKREGYKPPAHWEYIAQMKEHCPNTPVIANGDLWTVEDYQRCRDITGCENVALGRGAFANPFLAKQIKQLPLDDSDAWSQIAGEHLPQFIRSSKDFKNEHYAVTRTKQWTKFLARNFSESEELFQHIKTKKSLQDFPESLRSSL